MPMGNVECAAPGCQSFWPPSSSPAGLARAEDWPARPITLVVPYGAGGPTDVIGRLFAQQMSESLGRQIIVENVPAQAA